MGVIVPRGGQYLNTESGLSAPGGALDALTQAVANRTQYQGMLRGFGPALNDAGVPVPVPGPSVLSQVLGAVGLGGQQAPPQMPVATSGPGGGNGAAPPTISSGQPASGGPPPAA